MRHWLCGKSGGLAAFALITALVAGGLGWATRAALRLEHEQLEQRAEAEYAGRLRLALWRLDRVATLLAREDSRPFNHYSAIYAPPLALDRTGVWRPGSVVEPSPLLGDDLPEWMLLHFQADAASGWESPQVLSPALDRRLRQGPVSVPLPNVTPRRRELLARLAGEVPVAALLGHARQYASETTTRDRALLLARRNEELANTLRPQQEAQAAYGPEFLNRSGQLSKLNKDAGNLATRNSFTQSYALDVALRNFACNGEGWLRPEAAPDLKLPAAAAEVPVRLSQMVGAWLPAAAGGDELLFLLRLVRIEKKEICQGILLDAGRLRGLLAEEVQSLFPGSRLLPVPQPDPAELEHTMTALPFRLDTGPAPAPGDPGWTPLRVGLALAWAAALVALLAVGLGGRSLLGLSERRIRFVSAVTHELRTPLTTLRLYLDLLQSGIVRDEARREEYVRTLRDEADRLARLVDNVLDFSRLEGQRRRPARARVEVAEVLAAVEATWRGRCKDAGKELVVEAAVEAGAAVSADAGLLQQVLSNLIDNACKYSRAAEDRRVWVRARPEGRRVLFEVEDRGPGVPRRERRAVFRAFRRGGGADGTAGGVGLGLALARGWVSQLGGRLRLRRDARPAGACFQVRLRRWDWHPFPEPTTDAAGETPGSRQG
jgi:signal transduction histidine kinase